MATPESNTMLALQLGQLAFQPIAERRQLQQRLADMDREDALKKQLADDQNRRYIELENLRATNSQTLADKAGLREDARAKAKATLDDDRQNTADVKQLRAAIATNYPRYTAAAEQAGEEAMELSDFEESWIGLGQIQKEIGRLVEKKAAKIRSGAADMADEEINRTLGDVAAADKQLLALQQPSEADKQIAHDTAVKAVEAEILANPGKVTKKSSELGMAALRNRDLVDAQKNLGPALFQTYTAAVNRTANALLNVPERRDAISQAARAKAQAKAVADKLSQNIYAGMQTSSELQEVVKRRRADMLKIQTEEAPDTSSTAQKFQGIFGAQPQAGGAAPGAGAGVGTGGGASQLSTGNPVLDRYQADQSAGQAASKANERQSRAIQLLQEKANLEQAIQAPPQAFTGGAYGSGIGMLPPVDHRPAAARRLLAVMKELQDFTSDELSPIRAAPARIEEPPIVAAPYREGIDPPIRSAPNLSSLFMNGGQFPAGLTTQLGMGGI